MAAPTWTDGSPMGAWEVKNAAGTLSKMSSAETWKNPSWRQKLERRQGGKMGWGEKPKCGGNWPVSRELVRCGD